MILRSSDLAERSECRQRVKILGLGVVKNPSLFWHRLAKGEGPPVEIAAECFSPLFFFRAAASQSTLLHVAGTQGERRRVIDRKRSKSREGRGREREGRRAVSGGERAQLMI